MNRQQFIYKEHDYGLRLELKPYCFRWVLAYRLREFYLWLFWTIAEPFYKLGVKMNKIDRWGEISASEIRKRCFKPLRLDTVREEVIDVEGWGEADRIRIMAKYRKKPRN